MMERRFPIGAEVTAEGVHFRVWAPRCQRIEVVLETGQPAAHRLEAEENGYFSGLMQVPLGTRYRFRLDGAEPLYPDPASRFQPEGPHGPSEIVDPMAFRWGDSSWRGAGARGQVIYEMHIGTFTPEGTFDAASRKLDALADLGITMIEVMPVADFPGQFGWGYDGVDLFAPTRLYGRPDDFRRFVDQAHARGLAVILDVVYNHLGPDGNYLKAFSDHYFTDRYQTDWGEPLNFDGEDAAPVREFYITNAGYWIDEFHLDGLRLDATQSIFDDSAEHILTCIARRVRETGSRRECATFLVAENEPQETRLVRSSEKGGYGLDALWNDDFHHSAVVALTGHDEAYYLDYPGNPQEFISAVKYGYLYQGQRYKWQKKRRGTPTFDLPPTAFVCFLENHDQVANSGRGLREHALTSPGKMRAMTALLLLAPGTPMLFQGQEFAASSPFLYFADHAPDLARLVRKGRHQFLAQFPTLATEEMQAALPDPADPATFQSCKLDWSERERHAAVVALHRDLLRLRREDSAFRAQRQRGVDGAVLGATAFVLRYFVEDGLDRLLLVNLGRDLHFDPAPEPLLAPPAGMAWELLWSSEEFAYGGGGTRVPDGDDNWHVPGEAAVALRPVPKEKEKES